MKYEIYSIREGFTLFKQQLEECRSLLSELSNLPDILTLQKNILFLSDICKRQSLYIIEKTNVKVSLNACHSSLMNIKSEFLDDADKKIIQAEMQNIDRILNDIIASVSVKCDIASEEMATEENIKNTAERLEDFRAPAEFIQAYKDSVKLATAQSNDERLYQGINQRIIKESALVKEALDAGKSFVRGSVTVNSQIKPFDLRGLDYSVLKIPGISFNHARREVITPIYVFHNQKLAIVNVKKKKLSLKKGQYKDPDEVFSEKLEDLEKSTSLVNQTKRFHTPYLMSPLFKNVRFLWFSENLNAFKNTKDGEVKLLW